MVKIFIAFFLIVGLCRGSIINLPQFRPQNEVNIEFSNTLSKTDFWAKWGHHIMDFVNLIEAEEILAVLIDQMNDPEVLNFLGFLFSPEFTDLVWKFESIAEFKEAVKYLKLKGYEADSLVDMINLGLGLPPFETINVSTRNKRGLNGLIAAVIDKMPVEDMKKLFEQKLETEVEIAELFEAINSTEFVNILQRMAQNPEFIDLKKVFESYGFDLKYLCQLAHDILGEYSNLFDMFCK